MAMSPQERGRLGGLATKAKYGREHFAKIGKKGYAVMSSRYRLVPIGTSDWGFMNKDGKIVALLSGRKIT